MAKRRRKPDDYIISIITVLSHAFSYCIIIIDKIFGGAKMKIRIATPEDASAIQSIYRYYVEHTAITFELEVPSVEEFQGRIKKTLERYPYLVEFFMTEGHMTGQRRCRFMCRGGFTGKVLVRLFMRRWKSC